MSDPWRKCVEIGEAVLYLGDCLEVLPTLGPVDAVVTDPPYGVGIGSGRININRKKSIYDTNAFIDTEENVIANIIPAIKMAIEKASGRGIVTPGAKCMFLYPRPRVIGGCHVPSARGMSSWGFPTYMPVLFYGKDPRDGKGQSPVMVDMTGGKPSDERHPCAKPFNVTDWLVIKGSLEGHIILDPFMGIGTIGISCIRLGRRFIGIEIEEKYFDIACKRITREYEQLKLFPPEPPKEKARQLELEA